VRAIHGIVSFIVDVGHAIEVEQKQQDFGGT
jgi:hypothetical protein